MIVFLTLCYIVFLWGLIKLNFLRRTFWVELSVGAWCLILFVILFVPMQFYAPSGQIKSYQYIVPIVSQVYGQVIEVSIKPNTPLKKGDVLFKLNPQPFQYKVNSIEASLKASVSKYNLAEIEYTRAQKLVDTNAISIQKLDQSKMKLEDSLAQMERIKADLQSANFDLNQTVIKAPTNGYVTNLQIRVGSIVGKLPNQSVISFVDTSQIKFIIEVNQSYLRYIKAEQKTEVIFNMFPGRVFTAKVVNVIPITGQGLLDSSGEIPSFVNMESASRYAILVTLNDEKFASAMPSGVFGIAAIYTDKGKTTQLIRKIMLRMQNWLNFFIPA